MKLGMSETLQMSFSCPDGKLTLRNKQYLTLYVDECRDCQTLNLVDVFSNMEVIITRVLAEFFFLKIIYYYLNLKTLHYKHRHLCAIGLKAASDAHN